MLRAVDGDNSKEVLYDSYNLLGAIYNELGEYNKAIDYHSKALSISSSKEILTVYQSKATSYNNLGFVYQNLNNYDTAIKYFKLGLIQENLITDKPCICNAFR